MFTSAISADEVIASLAGLEKRRALGALAGWQIHPEADRKNYPKALRLYLSALLLLYGTCKEQLLEVFGLTEQEFMEAWQSVFQYDADDMAVFDEILTPAFRNGGIDGLVAAAGGSSGMLSSCLQSLRKQEPSVLQDLMIDDLAAVKRHLDNARGRSRSGKAQIGSTCSKSIKMQQSYQESMPGRRDDCAGLSAHDGRRVKVPFRPGRGGKLCAPVAYRRSHQ